MQFFVPYGFSIWRYILISFGKVQQTHVLNFFTWCFFLYAYLLSSSLNNFWSERTFFDKWLIAQTLQRGSHEFNDFMLNFCIIYLSRLFALFDPTKTLWKHPPNIIILVLNNNLHCVFCVVSCLCFCLKRKNQHWEKSYKRMQGFWYFCTWQNNYSFKIKRFEQQFFVGLFFSNLYFCSRISFLGFLKVEIKFGKIIS